MAELLKAGDSSFAESHYYDAISAYSQAIGEPVPQTQQADVATQSRAGAQIQAPNARCPPAVTAPCAVYSLADLDSKSPMLYTKRAAAYISLRQQSQGLRDLTKALELDPTHVQVNTDTTTALS